ncbi:MAG TPA: hypothetical protein ENN63_08855 [Bacteroidetes bacterium]|nr:hypothetical protein [Bacteroidota bacterium]
MDMNPSRYRLEIKNIKFRDHGLVYPQTAIITHLNESNEPGTVELLGSVGPEEIFRWIDEGKDIILDYCVVRNFSLAHYRLSRGMDRKVPVILKNFSAASAWFEAQGETDFSLAKFTGEKVNFHHARFFRGKALFAGSRFEGIADFSYAHFVCGDIDFSNAVFSGGEVSFKNAVTGNGKKDFQYADFGKGNVVFTNTEFGAGELSFINAQFREGNVSFKVARIAGGKVDFRFARFGDGDISFERTEFGNSRVDFRTTEFHRGRVNFNRAVFGDGDVFFEGSELKEGKFSFKRAQLGNGEFNFEMAEFDGVDAIFDRTSFGNGPVSFGHSAFGSLSLKSCHLNHYIDLRVKKCGVMDLSDTVVRDIIDMKPYEHPVNIGALNLSGMRLLGVIFIDWEENGVKQLLSGQPGTTLREKAEQFRLLKENFNHTGQYSDEDRSYVEFKRFEARYRLERTLKKSRWHALWIYPWHGFKWLVVDVAGLYATAPIRVLISMLAWYVLFSITYWLMEAFGDSGIISSTGYTLSSVARAFYHSAITFFTIGYGDHFPVGFIRVISAVEGFAGMFLMAYFTVSLVRKILR